MIYVLAASGLLTLVLALCLTVDGLLTIYRCRAAQRRQRPLVLTVIRRDNVADDLMVLHLATAARSRLPAFDPGQYIQLSAAAGPQDRVIQRAYSLAAWQVRPRHYELGIKREPQGVMTSWLWQNAQPGCTLMASQPRGHFVLQRPRGMLVLIGAGIGITPMRAMLHAGLDSGFEIRLFHAARTVGQLLYREEFEQLAQRHARFSYCPVLTQPTPEWLGLQGRIDAQRVLAQLPDPAAVDIYLCASGAMMNTLKAGFIERGIDAARVHQEAFGAAQNADTQAYEVLVQPEGRTLTFQGQPSLLALLHEAGVGVDSDCRNGSCGACRMRCVSGQWRTVIEPQWPLNDGEMLACCSVPASNKLELALLDR